MSDVPPFGGPPGGYPPGGQPPQGPGQQPPPPQQPWGPPPGGYGYGSYGMPQPHPKGTTILVLGILGMVLCGIFGIVAWVMGHQARQEIQQNPSAYSNTGMVTAGWILGIVSTCLTFLGILIYIVAFGAIASSS